MKIAILADDQPGVIHPMAMGLKKMFDALGVGSEIFPEGLAILNHGIVNTMQLCLKNMLKFCINAVKPQCYRYKENVSWAKVKQFDAQIKQFDLIVVVCHIPNAFLTAQLRRIEAIRTKTKAPIVLYQNYYLATRGRWSRQIMDSGRYGSGFGLERYDWYLSASSVSEYPLSHEAHPYSLIGHDLRDASLFAQPNKPFKVLLDFKRKGYASFRQLQIQALEETDTEYTQLSGHYTQYEIRQLYCQHSALFLSFRESFGLPVVENQLCGNYIFTPHKCWVPSHYINKSLHVAGEGDLGSNFIVYDNELGKLKELIFACRKNYRTKKVIADFERQYPALYHGDLLVLKIFIDKVISGEINGNSHLQHAPLNKGIVSEVE